MFTIGIDPAQSGASCLVWSNNECKEALCVVSWKPRTRNKKKVYELTITNTSNMGTHHASVIVEDASEIGATIARIAVDRMKEFPNDTTVQVCCEDAYFGKSAKTSIIVARFAGLISGACIATFTANLIQTEQIQQQGKLDHITDATGVALWSIKQAENNQ